MVLEQMPLYINRIILLRRDILPIRIHVFSFAELSFDAIVVVAAIVNNNIII